MVPRAPAGGSLRGEMSGKDDEDGMDDDRIESMDEVLDREDREAEELARHARLMRYGQYRNAGLIALICLVLLILAPIFNRYLEGYEAVVADADADAGRVLVLTPDGMPREKPISREALGELRRGTYIRKDHFTWDPKPIPLDELYDDGTPESPRRTLPPLAERYLSEWRGTVTEITGQRLPTAGGGREGEQESEFRMTVEMEDGTVREMKVPAGLRPEWLPSVSVSRGVEELEERLEGRMVEKVPLAWDPVVLPERGTPALEE